MSETTTARPAAGTTARLAAENVTVRFGGLVALDNVSIDVKPGEIVGLVGPNGAGKSTLFGALSGLLRPNGGTVTMNGDDVTKLSPQARAMRGLSRTFQHPELFQGLTVREHVVLANRMLHSPRRALTDVFTLGGFRPSAKEEADRVNGVIDVLGLTPIADRPVAGLPLGQARLVEIARAVARGPEVILIDEGSSGLDQGETDELVGVLRQMVETRGVSLLLVEHDVELVLGLSDRVFVLEFGKLIASGTPAEIRSNELVKAAYLGEEYDGTATTDSDVIA